MTLKAKARDLKPGDAFGLHLQCEVVSAVNPLDGGNVEITITLGEQRELHFPYDRDRLTFLCKGRKQFCININDDDGDDAGDDDYSGNNPDGDGGCLNDKYENA